MRDDFVRVPNRAPKEHDWRPFWTPVGLQNATGKNAGVSKCLKRLVGPPGFEPGTSCTPSKRASQAAPRPEQRSASRLRPNTSARTMIRCTDSTNGKPTSEYSR